MLNPAMKASGMPFFLASYFLLPAVDQLLDHVASPHLAGNVSARRFLHHRVSIPEDRK
jgi:hypothetical protein